MREKGSGAPSYRHPKIRKCVTDPTWVRAFLKNCNLCERIRLSFTLTLVRLLVHMSDLSEYVARCVGGE